MFKLVDKLRKNQILSKDEFITLINCDKETQSYLAKNANEVKIENYGNKVYFRGLIEMTNYCKQDCYYCGIRKSNTNCLRYRLTLEDIISCCEEGYHIGFRTFVLQGGEDPFFTDDRMCEIIKTIKSKYPDCALTLSLGEKSFESYKRFFDCGADRYLLRHETANENHFAKLHPEKQTLKSRLECLENLKKIGFQVGCGFMVGSPYQTIDNIVEDLLFIKKFNPQMVGVGPFIPHCDTTFKEYKSGDLNITLKLLSIIRLMLPRVLLPSTTALATIDKTGREKGLCAGANVVMPNLSPLSVRRKYMLYNDKIVSEDEVSENKIMLEKQINSLGMCVEVTRGDSKNIEKEE